jgi:hypothetical protein
MNPNPAALNTLRLAHAELSDADFLTWGQTVAYVEAPSPVYATYQKLRALWNKQKADAALAVAQAADPNGAQLLFTIGVDINFPDTKSLLAQIPAATGGTVTEADCDLVRDLARTGAAPFGALGFVPTQAHLDALPVYRQLIAFRDVDGPGILTRFAEFAGVAVDQLISQAMDGQQVTAPTLAELVVQFEGAG